LSAWPRRLAVAILPCFPTPVFDDLDCFVDGGRCLASGGDNNPLFQFDVAWTASLIANFVRRLCLAGLRFLHDVSAALRVPMPGAAHELNRQL